jgi:hypothetical protein
MLIRELLPLFDDVTTIVEVSATGEVLREQLRAPEEAAYRPYAPGEKLDADTLLVGFVGPREGTQVEAEAIAPALRDLPVGGRAMILLGWPLLDLPYHQVLEELVTAGCQVLQVIPIDNAAGQGAHCAVVAARVDRLIPLRTHLSDAPIVAGGDAPDLRALLRLTGEYVFSDLLSRPLRLKLAEAGDRVKEQDKRIRQLEKELAATVAKADARVERARNDVASLRASTTFRVGNTVVQGARKPGKAIVSVPVGLVRIWRKRDVVEETPGQKS